MEEAVFLYHLSWNERVRTKIGRRDGHSDQSHSPAWLWPWQLWFEINALEDLPKDRSFFTTRSPFWCRCLFSTRWEGLIQQRLSLLDGLVSRAICKPASLNQSLRLWRNLQKGPRLLSSPLSSPPFDIDLSGALELQEGGGDAPWMW